MVFIIAPGKNIYDQIDFENFVWYSENDDIICTQTIEITWLVFTSILRTCLLHSNNIHSNPNNQLEFDVAVIKLIKT